MQRKRWTEIQLLKSVHKDSVCFHSTENSLQPVLHIRNLHVCAHVHIKPHTQSMISDFNNQIISFLWLRLSCYIQQVWKITNRKANNLLPLQTSDSQPVLRRTATNWKKFLETPGKKNNHILELPSLWNNIFQVNSIFWFLLEGPLLFQTRMQFRKEIKIRNSSDFLYTQLLTLRHYTCIELYLITSSNTNIYTGFFILEEILSFSKYLLLWLSSNFSLIQIIHINNAH